MLVTAEERDRRLSDSNNLLSPDSILFPKSSPKPKVLVPEVLPGRPAGKKNLDQDARAAIGTLAHFLPNETVGKIFDVSAQTASNLANGKVSGSYQEGKTIDHNIELQDKINEKLGRASDKAIDTLMTALGILGSDDGKAKLLNAKARELSTIAKDMAVIADKARPIQKNDDNKPNIIFYAPRFHKEEHYETVQVDK